VAEVKTEVWVSIEDGPDHMPCDQVWVNLPVAGDARPGRMGASVGANLLPLMGQEVRLKISIDGVIWTAAARVTGFAYTDYADEEGSGLTSSLELLTVPVRA
jgi:hypothetical protein